MCVSHEDRHAEQSLNLEYLRDERRAVFSIKLRMVFEMTDGAKTLHAVANRYRKSLINAQHGNFALQFPASITNPGEICVVFPCILRIASSCFVPSFLKSHGQESLTSSQTAHSTQAVSLASLCLGLDERRAAEVPKTPQDEMGKRPRISARLIGRSCRINGPSFGRHPDARPPLAQERQARLVRACSLS